MRGYYVPLTSGALLSVSAFLPWVRTGTTSLDGTSDMAGIWVVVLGLAAVTLAALSLYTKKNSRHPLLLVGLCALAILVTSHHWMARSMDERAWARSQALAIVEGRAASVPPPTAIGSGIYIGLAAAAAITLFGLTIVIKRVAQPYALTEDDDVD
jgi:hypothetical protein